MTSYPTEYFENPLRVRHTITALLRNTITQLPNVGRVLDLGCGDLGVLRQIAQLRPDLRLHGLDVGEVPLGKTAPNIEFTRGDVTTFSTETKYDLVIAIDVLEHLARPEQLIHTAGKALRTQGEIYVNAPSVTKLLLLGDENFFSDYSHVRPFSVKSMTRLLHDHGFQASKISVQACEASTPRLLYHLARGIMTRDPRYLNGVIKMIGGVAVEGTAMKVN